ncbi:hypothetical protein HPB48_002012 [Haemaphysalis longicornis]|uniref:Uncharacterized protein n=1 Tax=Haemaphysalis longicornis TaxID=44386 RepID=A0A9J6FKX4_HAELO|nr:hypothetical protein HPB48_002012 [Haemaphysalis longicornis]
MADVKTKKRNRLGNENLNSVLVIKSAFAASGRTCANMTVEHGHRSSTASRCIDYVAEAK